MSYLISVDAGMAQIKHAHENPRTGAIEVDLFQTICAEYNPYALGTPECLVTFEGKTYVIGDNENLHSLPRTNSKLTDTHKLCVYTAIAKSLISLGVNTGQTLSVHLLINVPLEEYRDPARLAEYQKAYEGLTVQIEVNHQLVRYVVDTVDCNYEGQGAIFHACQQDASLKTGLVCLTDVGGYNDTSLVLSSLRPIANGNRALDNGVLRLFYNVACELAKNPANGRLTKFDVERMTKEEHDFIAEGFEEVYHREATKVVHEIEQNVTTLTPNPNQTRFLFSGGGSQALAYQILEAFEGYDVTILQDSQFDNCLGMIEYELYKQGRLN